LKIHWIYIIFCTVVLSNAVSLNGATGKNLLYNNKFEDSGYVYDWRGSGCVVKQISTSKDVASGKYSALFQMTSGKKNAYIENKCPRIRITAGETYELSIMAKGHGTIQLSCYQLGGTPLHLKGLGSVNSRAFKLNNKWQNFTYRHTFTKQNILEFSYRILLEGQDAKVYLDNAKLRQIFTRKALFKISAASLLAYPGQKIKFKAGVEYSDKNIAAALQAAPVNFKASSVKLNKATGEIALQVPTDALGQTLKLNLFDQASGIGKHIFIEVFSKQQYTAIKQAVAKQTKPNRNLNVLILGDSLSDLFRGQNYVDWLRFWTSTRFKGSIKWYNYGVRGDYIPRILSRLQENRVWGRRRFTNIFKYTPDVVLIFCGHNDSRFTRRSGFKNLKVPVDKFKEDLGSLVRFLRKKNSAVKIVLMTPAASNFAKSKACWLKKGKRSDLFGNPEIMQQFQQMVKDVANEEKCNLVDIFKLTKEYPRNSELFQPDGVHLNSTGNYFVALKVLQGLTKSGYWKNCNN